MKHMLHAVTATFALSFALLAGVSEASDHRRVEFPGKVGSYVQIYDQDGVKIFEMAKVEGNGKVQIAKGPIAPHSKPMSHDEPLEDVTVDFGPCGFGKFFQPSPSMAQVKFLGFEGETGNCPIQNPANDVIRLDTEVN